MPKNNNTYTPQEAAKRSRTAGIVSLIAGTLTVIFVPVIYLLASSGTEQKVSTFNTTDFTAFIIFGILEGGVFIWFGLMLRQTTVQNLIRANKLLLYLSLYVIALAVVGFLVNRGGFGILGLLVLLEAVYARLAIKNLSKK